MSLDSSKPAALHLAYGYWSRPFRNTPPCGDGAGLIRGESESWLLVLDAIGHGPVAHRIARMSLDFFQTFLTVQNAAPTSVEALVLHLHQKLVSRQLDEQAAMNIYRFDHKSAKLEAIAIGNLDSFLITPTKATVIANQNGMVGGRLPQRLHRQIFELEDNLVLTVLSDGIDMANSTRQLPKYVYGPFTNRPLKDTARLIVDGYHRDHDDASCALIRISLDRP
jgi:hypothetical protein